jgi:hypothetical protein
MATVKAPAAEPTEEKKATTPKKDAKSMNLAQKFVELRRACPEIIKKQHSDGVKYKFAKIFDVYELLAPAMNEWGVDWDIVKEVATLHHENSDAKYYDSFIQKTKNGDRVVWVYEADITLRWINVDNPEETLDITLHALGTNDSSPDKAKGSAWTYCLKYYLFEKFNIDQGEDDPDNNDYGSDAPPTPQNGRQNAQQPQGGTNTPQRQQNARNDSQSAQRSAGLSEAQLNRLYKKAENCGMSKEAADKRIREKYNQDNPAELTRAQYEEICASLDAAAKK